MLTREKGQTVHKLTDDMVEMAMHRLELGGLELLRAHPDYEQREQSERLAYEAVLDKLTSEELFAIQNATGLDMAMHFVVGYAAGLSDGLSTRQALRKS